MNPNFKFVINQYYYFVYITSMGPVDIFLVDKRQAFKIYCIKE